MKATASHPVAAEPMMKASTSQLTGAAPPMAASASPLAPMQPLMKATSQPITGDRGNPYHSAALDAGVNGEGWSVGRCSHCSWSFIMK